MTRDEAMCEAANRTVYGPSDRGLGLIARSGGDMELERLEAWLRKRADAHLAAYERVKAEDARKPVEKARFGLQELHAKRWAEASDILDAVKARAHWKVG